MSDPITPDQSPDEPLPGSREIVASVRQIAMRAKSAWMDGHMKVLLPPGIYNAAAKGKGSDRFKVARWLAANKIALEEHPDHSVLVVDGKPISSFAVKFVDDKISILTKDLQPNPEVE